jgi:hypothetical protein
MHALCAGLVGLCLLLSGSPLPAQAQQGEATEPAQSEPGDRPATVPAVRPPKLTIVSSTVAKDGSIVVETQVEDPAGGEVELSARINGQPHPLAAIAQARGLATARRYTLTLRPQQRDGVLSLLARSGAGQSQPAQLRLRRGEPEARPALLVLSVGVGQYQSADIPTLRYAAKDASDLASTLQRQRDLLYREITVRVLSDGQATLQQVREGLRWLAESTGPDDTAVLFLAGHGTNDPDGQYFFLPADTQADRQTMLSGTALQEGLRAIAGRVILLLDTCHSGNVLGRRSYNRLINDLTQENRIVVFAASTGDQVARESPAWQNGAFTKALVEGLRGVADYAEDNRISMSELETWASVRVQQLTSGSQTPTLAKPNAAPDYVLAALPDQGVLPNPKRAVRKRLLWWAGGVSLGLALGVGVTVGVAVQSSRPSNVVMPTWVAQ